MNTTKYFLMMFVLMVFAVPAHARGSGGAFGGGGMMGSSSLGFGIGIMSPSQDDLDSHIDQVNATHGVAVGKFSGAYEFVFDYEYRFSGSMFALQFRPSYFTSKASGAGYDYKLTGYTFYPILKIYALENDFIHFYLQTGVGYGQMNGTLSQPGASVDFSGGAFGILGGLGAEFCFTESHCVAVEGNLRYLPFERTIASGVSGSPSNFSQVVSGQELEYNGSDLKTTMSGIQGLLSYQLKF